MQKGQDYMNRINIPFLTAFQQVSGVPFLEAFERIKRMVKYRRLSEKRQSQYQTFRRNVQNQIAFALQNNQRAISLKKRLQDCKRAVELDQIVSQLLLPEKSMRQQINNKRSKLMKEVKAGCLVDLTQLKALMDLYWTLYGRKKFDILVNGQLNKQKICSALTSLKLLLSVSKQKVKREYNYSVNVIMKKCLLKAIAVSLSERPQKLQEVTTILKKKWIGPKGYVFLKNAGISQKEVLTILNRMDFHIESECIQAQNPRLAAQVRASYKSIRSKIQEQTTQPPIQAESSVKVQDGLQMTYAYCVFPEFVLFNFQQ